VAFGAAVASGAAAAWADRHGLRLRALRFAHSAFAQLDAELRRAVEPHLAALGLDAVFPESDDDRVARALTYGLCLNAAERGVHDNVFALLPGAGAALDDDACREDGDALRVPGNRPGNVVVRLDDDAAAALPRAPDAICFHDLALAHRAVALAHNAVVVHPPTLHRARRRLGAATVRRLCGSTEPSVSDPPSSRGPSPGSGGAPGSDPRPGPSSDPRARDDVDAARHRFLDRKRRKRASDAS